MVITSPLVGFPIGHRDGWGYHHGHERHVWWFLKIVVPTNHAVDSPFVVTNHTFLGVPNFKESAFEQYLSTITNQIAGWPFSDDGWLAIHISTPVSWMFTSSHGKLGLL